MSADRSEWPTKSYVRWLWIEYYGSIGFFLLTAFMGGLILGFGLGMWHNDRLDGVYTINIDREIHYCWGKNK